jgi:ribulose-phosphate 3-epimerase
MNAIKISPSMMCADLTRLGEEVRALEAAGADMLHWDIMDGQFAHNFALSPMIVAGCRPVTTLPFDVHLGILDPAGFIDEVADAGADIISLQLETTPHLHRAVQRIHARGKKAGVVVNPVTPLCFLETILSEIQMVTLMTVDFGFAGQSFVWPVLDKVRALRRMVHERGLPIDIQVDGQINAPTIGPAVAAGANVLVVGTSGLFTVPGGFAHAMQQIRARAAQALSNPEAEHSITSEGT